MKNFLKEFREFAMRGNVIDLAVAVVIGAAFGRIVSSLVSDIIMPPIGVLLGGVDFSDLFITLSEGSYDSLAEAEAAGAATINYGVFINQTLDFIIIAFAIFLLVQQINRLQEMGKKDEKPAEEEPTTKTCPYCKSEIPIEATRCKYCTSQLEAETPAA